MAKFVADVEAEEKGESDVMDGIVAGSYITPAGVRHYYSGKVKGVRRVFDCGMLYVGTVDKPAADSPYVDPRPCTLSNPCPQVDLS